METRWSNANTQEERRRFYKCCLCTHKRALSNGNTWDCEKKRTAPAGNPNISRWTVTLFTVISIRTSSLQKNLKTEANKNRKSCSTLLRIFVWVGEGLRSSEVTTV